MPITVHKRDSAGRETWHYTGEVLSRGPDYVNLQARFNAPEKVTAYTTFRPDDRFVEWFYSDRWFNIFAVYDVADDHLKGWYCNITRPAILEETAIYADDLALDLWVYPDGSALVLDEDEFEALALDAETRAAAMNGLATLRAMVETRAAPFADIPFAGGLPIMQ